LQNSDVIVIQGSNMAECHPVGFRWVMKARERGATIIHVDPRFTRTSAVANIHVPIRAGSDIAFLGGIIHYILEGERYFKDYVVNYTNASAIVSDEFRDTEDLDGLFSGWNESADEYDKKTWKYKGEKDPTLENPRCVFQILKRHFSRYTPEMVEKICGVPPALLNKVAETLCRNSGRERTGAFCYAVGWTQHTVGVQYIRTAAIVQLLLGNMGRPGGGIMALRGHTSIQGSTDIPTLFNILPGYLPMPDAKRDPDLKKYLERNTPGSGWWGEFPKYFVSLMKAYFGDAARKENDWCYDYLPMLTGDHSHMNSVVAMADGKLDGYFVMGENPTVGSMHGALHRKGLRELKWLVVRDLNLIETAEFWRDAPEIHRGEVKTEEIGTEVFFFPAAAHTEKDGAFTNTQRLLQWHHKAIDPPGDCQSELDFVYQLGVRLKELYASEFGLRRNWAIRDLTWDYPGREVVKGLRKKGTDRSVHSQDWTVEGQRTGGDRVVSPQSEVLEERAEQGLRKKGTDRSVHGQDSTVEGQRTGGDRVVSPLFSQASLTGAADRSTVQVDAESAVRDSSLTGDADGSRVEIDAESVLREINGYTVADGQVVDGFAALKEDGSTACGCWIYSGAYKGGVNMPARRRPQWEQDWVALEWGWSWPSNRRLMYNRASADPEGKPWSERKKYVWWDEARKQWTGFDTPDFILTLPPSHRPAEGARGKETISGVDPFIMQTDGKGWIYVPVGLVEGPLPAHYEPEESVMKNLLYGQQCNPMRMEWRRRDNPYHQPYDDPRFPFVFTTYRVTEHHTAGGMSRWLPWLAELQPELFCEVSPELAEMRGLVNGGWATIRTERAEIEARVLVTRRVKPLKVDGRVIHQIGLPYHWSSKGIVVGDTVNELIGFVGDPNVSIQESKAFTGMIEAGRRSRERRAVTSGALVRRVDPKYWERDLPEAREKPGSEHGFKAAETKEGHE
jgi:anaerobic selenocysteine-containing dehydrogenase